MLNKLKPAFFLMLTWLLIMTGLPYSSFADDLHYKNMIVGDRPASMGGAYVAVSDTPEGTFYNPSGLVYSVGSNLSVSVNAYHNTWKKYDNVSGIGDYTRKSSSIVPNFFGVVQPLGIGKIAFSYAVPDIIEEDQNQSFTLLSNPGKFVINRSSIDKTYKIGPSYAVKLSDSFSLGATLYFHYREEKLNLNQYLLFFSNNAYESQSEVSRKTEYGVNPKIGLMWSPLDKVSFGLTVSKVDVFKSNFSKQVINRTNITNSSITDNPEPVFAYSKNKRKHPISVSAGVAYFPSEDLLFSCDIDYFEAVPDENKRAVANISIGTEYYLSDRYALRGGLYSDMANSQPLKRGYTDQADYVNIFGITGGITRFTRTTSMTFGFNYASGEGEAQPVGGVTDIYKTDTRALTLFFSGSYGY